VADTWAHARQAAKCVVQKYEQMGRPVVELEEGERLGRTPSLSDLASAKREDGSVGRRSLPYPQTFGRVSHGTAANAKDAKHVEGSFRWGHQYHFYMETQAVVVTPLDGDRCDVHVSTQDPDFTSQVLAHTLSIPEKEINVKCIRAGGGFGGKARRHMPLTCAVAVAAWHLKQQVRGQMERSDDMEMNSGREEFDVDYSVAFDSNGKVDSMDMLVHFGPGWYVGDLAGDMEMGIQMADDCYHYNSFKTSSIVTRTDIPHGTYCRGPGVQNACVAAQVVMEHIARSLGKPTEEVMALNFYKEGQSTPFGDVIGRDGYNFTVPLLWEELQKKADFEARKVAVGDYNNKNRWTKKGIAISPVKYVILRQMYPVGALVCVHSDGSVVVSTGGCEIGQGLNTKVALCAAETLGLPVERISVAPVETQRLPNGAVTGGSATSECYCDAVILACEEIRDRLKVYTDKKMAWNDAITQANADAVGLIASSWTRYRKTANTDTYATYGAAVSEVLVDILTGEVRVERVDIVMDLGTQLDAAVDIGQLQGGFMMALGYLLTEEMRWDDSGKQIFLGTWDYKIPTAYDIPIEFNVSLLKDSPNPVGVKGSKACAEPVMPLIASTLLAAKEALYAARKDAGLGEGWFPVELPLTPQRVQAATGRRMDHLVVPS